MDTPELWRLTVTGFVLRVLTTLEGADESSLEVLDACVRFNGINKASESKSESTPCVPAPGAS